ncbi:MAG: 5-oxoprolinase subunit PxpB [Deltaproteobacteria bacterium]|nr:5-oxoprolinase subunit PxpB [Deltaproteobacteria bacterium]
MAATLYEQARIRLSGDRALLVEYGDGIDPVVNDKVRAVTALLKKNLPAGVEAVVPAYRSLSILYDPLATTPAGLAEILHALEADSRAVEIAEPKVVPIPVCYGGEFGPDIGVVAEHTSLQENEIVAIHASVDYPIYMIGFMPGFCYLGGLDRRLQTPRRKTPRTNLPAGSVGVAESQTGMYPVDSPGGWQIIGRTPLRLFAPARENPFLYEEGDRIRFVPIAEAEFGRLYEKEWS